MATQKSIIKLKGTLQDITFYKSKDGYIVREKGGIDGKRIATDPVFQRTRENGSEFGRAATSAKVLRMAFRSLAIHASDSNLISRLQRLMMKVLQADTISVRGLRNVIDGEAELLSGFEFNNNGQLATNLFAPYVGGIDRVTGAITVDLASFIPINMLAAPFGTTHFKIISGGAEVDFEGKAFVTTTSETVILPWDNLPTAAISLSNAVTAASTKPLFLALGIQYFQEVNGQMYPLKNGAFNPLSVVKVDSGV